MCELTNFKNILEEFKDKPNKEILIYLEGEFLAQSRDEAALTIALDSSTDSSLKFLLSYLHKERGIDIKTAAREITKMAKEKDYLHSISQVI